MKDFGTVKDQARVEERFTVANSTPNPVHIVKIQTSCECTKLELSDTVIPPQGTITARMTVDLRGQFGKRQFESILSTDSSLAPVLRLAIGGTVAVTALDGEIPFDIGAFPPDAEINETVSLSKLGNSTAKITAAEQSGNGAMKIEPSPEDDPDFFRLRVSGRAPKESGTFQAAAQLTAKGTDWKQAKIVVRGMVRSRWRYPRSVSLGFVRAGETIKKEFQISDSFSDGGTPGYIRHVSVASKCRSVEAVGSLDGPAGVRVALTLRHAGTAGPLSCELTVKLIGTDQQEYVLEILVLASCL